jgi:hypothetical protein
MWIRINWSTASSVPEPVSAPSLLLKVAGTLRVPSARQSIVPQAEFPAEAQQAQRACLPER